MISLKSTRLILAPFSPDDEVLLHTLFTDPFIREHLWDSEIVPIETTRDILAKNQQYFTGNKWGLWQVRLHETGDTIGFSGLWPFFDELQPQLLYGLFEKYTRRGYATEACTLVLEYCFGQLGFTCLRASMDEGNTSSNKVAEKLGMALVDKRMEKQKPTVFYEIEKSWRE